MTDEEESLPSEEEEEEDKSRYTKKMMKSVKKFSQRRVICFCSQNLYLWGSGIIKVFNSFFDFMISVASDELSIWALTSNSLFRERSFNSSEVQVGSLREKIIFLTTQCKVDTLNEVEVDTLNDQDEEWDNHLL